MPHGTYVKLKHRPHVFYPFFFHNFPYFIGEKIFSIFFLSYNTKILRKKPLVKKSKILTPNLRKWKGRWVIYNKFTFKWYYPLEKKNCLSPSNLHIEKKNPKKNHKWNNFENKYVVFVESILSYLYIFFN
jgi:hypothetical protein